MDPMRQAKRPVIPVAGPYGHPLHPALVAVPIGAWIASLVFDLGSRFVDNGAFLARGSRWLIVLGVLGALVAAMVGFLDFFAIPGGTPAFRTAVVHLSLNLAVTAAYAVNFLLRDAAAPRVGWGPLALSGYLGGKLAYRYGVRVADESTQSEGYRVLKAGEKEQA
jgi:uncharacterized membrane protein